jgi:hypothetical protein
MADLPKKKRRRAWTEDDDRRLLEARAVGRSSRVIAVALKRSATAVDRRLFILKARTQSGKDIAAAPDLKIDA